MKLTQILLAGIVVLCTQPVVAVAQQAHLAAVDSTNRHLRSQPKARKGARVVSAAASTSAAASAAAAKVKRTAPAFIEVTSSAPMPLPASVGVPADSVQRSAPPARRVPYVKKNR